MNSQKNTRALAGLSRRWVQFTKNHYFFKNWPSRKTKSLIFFGCNYPAFFPQTCERIAELASRVGADWCVDCCGKPIVMAGGLPDSEGLKKKIADRGCQEVITACPNCFTRLRRILDVPVLSLPEFLHREGLAQKIERSVHVFFPCGDGGRQIFEQLQPYLSDWDAPFQRVGCCGLGGPPQARSAEHLRTKQELMTQLGSQGVDVYCASCGGQFCRFGLTKVRNLISDLVGVCEVPGAWLKGAWRFKIKKRERME